MSTGGQYQLIANTGPQDILLTATELLNKRLKEIHRLRCKHPAIKDPTPTLTDIERTHIFFINAHFKPFVSVGYEYTKIGPDQGTALFGQTLIYSIPQYGDFFNDMVLHVTLSPLTATAGNLVKCADFLGHRFMQQVQFQVNGNNLDQYDYDTYNFHYAFTVPPEKRLSYSRCIGQQVPTPAYVTQNPGIDQFQEVKYIVNGYQTYKNTHPMIDLWIPLLFWFNMDARLSIPSISIPYGQRFIYVTLATPELLFAAYPAVDGYTAPTILNADLYINNIFVNPEIQDIFIRRVGFQMIRVHVYQRASVTTAVDQILLDTLRYPIETLFVGCRVLSNYNSIEDWAQFSLVQDNIIPFPVAIPNPAPPPAYALEIASGLWKTYTQTLDTINIQTKGIDLYRIFPVNFHNFYLPYNFGTNSINSPDQTTMYMLPFCMYPGSYQPSGHINLSRSREFYINYTSSVISTGVPCELFVLATAINFLLVAEGQAALRYNT